MRQQPPLGSRTWKPEEEDYLMEKWGADFCPGHRKEAQPYNKCRQGQSAASWPGRGADGR